jgi:hypothetical protein
MTSLLFHTYMLGGRAPAKRCSWRVFNMANTTTQGSFHASSYLTFPPDASARVPATPALYAKYVLPMYVSYYTTAVLVQKPETRLYRVTLLPVTLALIWIVAVAFDLSGGDARYNYLNVAQMVSTKLFPLNIRLDTNCSATCSFSRCASSTGP